MEPGLYSDFVEMLAALRDAGVDHLVIGAQAVAAHGYPRATGDLDIWVRPTRDNAERVIAALEAFGAPLFGLTVDDLCALDTVYQIGIEPVRIDILTDAGGVTFDRAWENRLVVAVGAVPVPFIGRDDLIATKRAAGRQQDLADIAALERVEP